MLIYNKKGIINCPSTKKLKGFLLIKTPYLHKEIPSQLNENSEFISILNENSEFISIWKNMS